jgi:hypothetical protein
VEHSRSWRAEQQLRFEMQETSPDTSHATQLFFERLYRRLQLGKALLCPARARLGPSQLGVAKRPSRCILRIIPAPIVGIHLRFTQVVARRFEFDRSVPIRISLLCSTDTGARLGYHNRSTGPVSDSKIAGK